MKVIKGSPSAKLQPYIRHYWWLEINIAHLPFRHLFFPFGFHELIFNKGTAPGMQYLDSNDSFTQPLGFFAGQFTKPFFLYYDQPCTCVGISLQPWAGTLLFDMPSDCFTDYVQDISHLNDFNKLRDAILLSDDSNQLFPYLDDLFEQLLLPKRSDEVSIEIAMRLMGDPLRKNIQSTIDSIGLSRRRIEQRFSNNIGLSIGSFVRKARFQKAASMLLSSTYSENLTNWARSGLL